MGTLYLQLGLSDDQPDDISACHRGKLGFPLVFFPFNIIDYTARIKVDIRQNRYFVSRVFVAREAVVEVALFVLRFWANSCW